MVRPEQSHAFGPAAAKTYGSPICERAKASTLAATEALAGRFETEKDEDRPEAEPTDGRGSSAASSACRACWRWRWRFTTSFAALASRLALSNAALALSA